MSLGFTIIHTFCMVIAFEGYAGGTKTDQVFVPIIHLIAAMLVRFSTSQIFLKYFMSYESSPSDMLFHLIHFYCSITDPG